MELKLGIGIGEIKFGMLQADVSKLLGAPDRVYQNEDDDNQLLVEWFPLKLRLTFYLGENERLGYIRTKNSSLTYNGVPIIGKNIELVKNEILGKAIDIWEIEDYGAWLFHFDEKHWLSLHEEFGVVDNLEMGVPFKNENEYAWPA